MSLVQEAMEAVRVGALRAVVTMKGTEYVGAARDGTRVSSKGLED